MNDHSFKKVWIEGFKNMRPKDQKKYDAIVSCSIELITKLGFANISIHKIAEKAKVSPATIYIHFKNKNDLFEKIYIMIRKNISAGTLQGIEMIPEHNIEQLFKTIWKNSFLYNKKHPEYLKYREKFEQTHLIENVQNVEIDLQKYVESLFFRGIKDKKIKNLPIPLLISFAYGPVVSLVKLYFSGVFKMNEDDITKATNFAWNAIRLN